MSEINPHRIQVSPRVAARFRASTGHDPSPAQRKTIALFPSPVANPTSVRSLSISTFTVAFRNWLACDGIDLPGHTTRQARHTLATQLIAAGASMTHVKKVLGHVSEAMSEAYVLIAGTQVEPYLQQVWVKGPGSTAPGEVVLLPTADDTSTAARLLIDLAVVPVEHGLCTFKPVAGGATCPFGRACHACEHFVLTGADYSYWKRQEQRQAALAEGAPTTQARDYIYQAFEPSARAIAGLEKALASAGLLDQARQLDLRTPRQDFLHPLWRTGWHATDLAGLASPPPASPGHQETPA